LNPDGVIEIGQYLMKIDGINGTCYVISDVYINEYYDLVTGNMANSHIQRFLNEEDVLEILQIPDPNLRCRENGDPHKKWDRDYYLSACSYCVDVYILDCKIVYQKLGIYFSLIAKAKWFYDQEGLWGSTPT